MINYGVVYPQAILIFTITILYSVVQPLIVIFGAVYFGVAYVVYKYKLLFGIFQFYVVIHTLIIDSVLQTLRIAGAGVASDICPSHLGCCHLSRLHDGLLPPFEIVRTILPSHAAFGWNGSVVVVGHQGIEADE